MGYKKRKGEPRVVLHAHGSYSGAVCKFLLNFLKLYY